MALDPTFAGVGCYAVYYTGDHPIYTAIADLNREDRFGAPIYVGRSQDKGSRTGAATASAEDNRLRSRLMIHRRSITAAVNLDIGDFYCRWLVTDQVWVSLAEPSLIRRFQPIWNTLLAGGFGNHAPGGGRDNQRRSPWDTVHPGRPGAANLPPNDHSRGDLEIDIAEYIRARLQP